MSDLTAQIQDNPMLLIDKLKKLKDSNLKDLENEIN